MVADRTDQNENEADSAAFWHFSFLTGTWALNETDAALLILFPVRVEIVFVSAVALILMVPSFVWFTKGFFDVEDKWGSDIICVLAYLNLAVQLILQLAGIRGFRQMYTVTHVLLGVALLYTIVMLISEYRKTKVHRHLRFVVVGGFILLGTLAADLLHFYYGSFQTSIYGMYGVFIYIIILRSKYADKWQSRWMQGGSCRSMKNLQPKIC